MSLRNTILLLTMLLVVSFAYAQQNVLGKWSATEIDSDGCVALQTIELQDNEEATIRIDMQMSDSLNESTKLVVRVQTTAAAQWMLRDGKLSLIIDKKAIVSSHSDMDICGSNPKALKALVRLFSGMERHLKREVEAELMSISSDYEVRGSELVEITDETPAVFRREN